MLLLENNIKDEEEDDQDESLPLDESVSCFKISYDTGKATQLFCDPLAQCVGFSSASLCGLLLLSCCELCYQEQSSNMTYDERADVFVQLNKPRVEHAGLCGSSLVRANAHAVGNLFGFFRASTQLCLGPFQASDKVLGYTPEQIKNAPGICDKISLWDDQSLTPRINDEPMQSKIA
jgi:hypothetical protein